MAAFSTIRWMLDTLIDDTDDLMWSFMKNQSSNDILICNQRRDSVPNIDHYMDVINRMRIPENIDDFKYHYRLSRNLFDVILGEVYDILVRKGKGQHETVTPEKQLLVGICYLANTQSMREVAHTFNLSKSTVHRIINDVCDAIGQIGNRVSDFQIQIIPH